MKLKLNLRKEIRIAAILVGVFLLIGFTERKQNSATCKNVVIELENINENHFIDEADILQIINSSGQTIIGNSIDKINLRMLEAQLKSDTHIEEAELFGDVKGNLMVSVKLRRPVARLVRTDGPDAYVAEDGIVMRVSDKFSARVLLLSGPIVKELIEAGDLHASEDSEQIMEMINYINDDPFWKAQIAQLDFNKAGKVFIYPQVTGQIVEFGKPEDVELKFEKLMIFYKEILPQMGWNKYDRVNVEYEGQVVAE